MPNPKDSSPANQPGSSEHEEFRSEDFQFVLKELLAAYQPILEADLKRLKESPAELEKEAEAAPQNREEELTQAKRIFDRFVSQGVAARLLPEAARKQLGPIENWTWCLQNVRCCLIFGWLVCRGPRTFRAFVYYVYQYWLCIRESLDTPVSKPPTDEQRKDFQVLVEALAKAYKPYLTDQLASVEFPAGLPDEALAGKIDVAGGQEDMCAIFERFLTGDTAQALLGKEAFSEHRRDPNFWFCRCWCLSAICFGCCLAKARSIDGLLSCLASYFRSLGKCANPLACDLTGPTGCIRGETDILAGKILEPVVGGAYGFSFGRYVIEVRDGAGTLLSGVVIYPDSLGNPDPSLTQGSFAVASGNLAWLDLQQCVIAAGIEILTSTSFTVTLRVFATDGAELTPDCVTTFELSLDEVYIKQISTPWSVAFMDPSEPLRVANSSSAALATEGGLMQVRGLANITGCAGELIAEYTIWAIPDSTFSFPQPATLSAITPGSSWVLVTHIEYTAQVIAQPSGPPTTFTVDQVRAAAPLDGSPDSVLTNVWGVSEVCPSILIDSIDFAPKCYNFPSLIANALDSNTLPKMRSVLLGGTGKFTFLLQVIDTAGNTYYDVQRAWIDNEQVQAAITGIGGYPPCADLYTQTSGSVFKTVNIMGIAWDQLIEPGDPSASPAVAPDYTQPTSDNFSSYTVVFQKQGAAEYSQLISSTTPVPPRPLPVAPGILTAWNLQSLDAASNPMGLPADQLLALGQSCTYNVILQVWDSTIVNENTTHYSGLILFPIKIINGPEPI